MRSEDRDIWGAAPASAGEESAHRMSADDMDASARLRGIAILLAVASVFQPGQMKYRNTIPDDCVEIARIAGK